MIGINDKQISKTTAPVQERIHLSPQQAGSRPACQGGERIGCAYKRDFCAFLCRLDCCLEIGWSPIFGKILGQFLCHLSIQDNLYCLAHGEVT